MEVLPYKDLFSSNGAWSQINNFPRLFPVAAKTGYDPCTVTVSPDNILSPTDMNAFAGSYESSEPPQNALDNNMSTLWHTDWNGCTLDQRWIAFDLNGIKTITGLQYFPRPSGDNGYISGYRILISSDGVDYKEVSKGDWELNSDLKTVNFDQPYEAAYVKLQATATKGEYASAAEIRIKKPETVLSFSVEEIETLESKTVKYGTSFEELELPKVVSVTLDNGTTGNLDVTWKKADYGISSGTYGIKGELTLPEVIKNPYNKQPVIHVTIQSSSSGGSSSTPETPTVTEPEEIKPPVEEKKDKTKPSIVKNKIKNGKITLSATDKDSGIDKIYYSTDGKKFKVYTKGFYLPVGKNKLIVYAVDKEGNIGGKKTYTITVKKPEITKTIKISEGKSYTLKLKYKDGASKISYTSSNKNIVIVDKKGKVTAKKPGKAVVTTVITIGGKKTTLKTVITVLSKSVK